MLLYSFSLFYFEFEGNFTSTSPQGLIFGGAIYWRGFCVASLGGLYLEGLIFEILRYSYKEVRRISFFKTSENVIIRYHLICLIRGPLFYATSHHLPEGIIHCYYYD